MTVYLDLVMGLNFLVDLLLLAGTNRLAGYPTGLGRASLAAALGSVYGGACLLPGFRFLGNLLWRMVSLGLMSLLAFGTGKGMLRRSVLFVLLSMALGGIAIGLGTGGFWTLVAAAVAVFAMCVLGFGGNAGQRKLVPVRLTNGSKTVHLTALHDTGNTLRDPVTGERILVAGPCAAMELLGLGREALLDPVGTMEQAPFMGLRLVPYRAVGKAHGFLLSVRVREAEIGGRKGSVTVAFTAQGLGDGQEEFDALIGGVV